MDSHGDQRAADHGNRVDVGDLSVRIEDRHQEETGESADKCGGNYLEGNHHATPGAPMRVGEMPLAAWTGGHQECVRTLRTQ